MCFVSMATNRSHMMNIKKWMKTLCSRNKNTSTLIIVYWIQILRPHNVHLSCESPARNMEIPG